MQRINDMFDLATHTSSQLFENIKISNGYVEKDDIMNILKEDGFIFPM